MFYRINAKGVKFSNVKGNNLYEGKFINIKLLDVSLQWEELRGIDWQSYYEGMNTDDRTVKFYKGFCYDGMVNLNSFDTGKWIWIVFIE